MLHVREVQIIRGPSGRTNRRQAQDGNNITRHPVILVHALSIIHATVQLRNIILREAHNSLEVNKNVKGKTEAGVCGFKVLVAGPCFVHLDDDEAGSQGRGADEVEEEVGDCAGALLVGGMRGLQDQGCLDGEEEAGLCWRVSMIGLA